MENLTQSAADVAASAFRNLAHTARSFKLAQEEHAPTLTWLKRNLGASDANGAYANLLEIQKRSAALALAADRMAGELVHAEMIGIRMGLPRLKTLLGLAMRGEDPYVVGRKVYEALAE